MKRILPFLGLIGMLILSGCEPATPEHLVLTAPNGDLEVTVGVNKAGAPWYRVARRGTTVIDTSGLGFDFQDQPALAGGLEIVGSTRNTVNETWELPWGEQREVVNAYNELSVQFKETKAPHRNWDVTFRAFNDGIGFRHEFPVWEGVDTVRILEEHTQFALTGDHTCWWSPGDWDSYEHKYNTSRFSEINAVEKQYPLAQTYIPHNSVNTPFTMRSASGLHLSFHEANLTDYAGMTTLIDPENLSMKSELVGSERVPWKVKRALPFTTPWRTIQISEDAPGLLASNLILNLNEPNQLGDVSWFKPKKYVGIWWEMHLGVADWELAKGNHGATTANAKRYIDFAAENGITGLLVEGWNTGWEHWIGFDDREGVFDFVTPYPDYDLQEVVRYANEKGVEIIMHHETSAAPRTYDQQMDTAYALMQSLGIHSVKSGYVGPIIPKGEYHHGQWMVNFYRKALEKAADYEIAVNAHEPIKDTGIRRTLPNAISREGARGQEFNAWADDGGNPAEHLSIVAFTRMLGGPFDFTPGVFDITLPQKENNQINTTLAQQLALYVVIYSPIQMACDLPQNYEGQPAFQFIREVGVDWEQTQVLAGDVGDYVIIAREERETGNWFLGAITNENERAIQLNFEFLEPGKEYTATVYRDGEGAHYRDNPTALIIEEGTFTAETTQSYRLAPGGGIAISLMVAE